MTIKEYDRYCSENLSASERPKAFHKYYVTGTGAFPFDMLRYDRAWPSSSDDVAMMMPDYNHYRRSILMHSYAAPVVARWTSFTWSVGTERLPTVRRMIA